MNLKIIPQLITDSSEYLFGNQFIGGRRFWPPCALPPRCLLLFQNRRETRHCCCSAQLLRLRPFVCIRSKTSSKMSLCVWNIRKYTFENCCNRKICPIFSMMQCLGSRIKQGGGLFNLLFVLFVSLLPYTCVYWNKQHLHCTCLC